MQVGIGVFLLRFTKTTKSLSPQSQLIAEIEALEQQIKQNETIIQTASNQKQAMLKQYLQN